MCDFILWRMIPQIILYHANILSKLLLLVYEGTQH